jgi:glycosyltransferase involved in cell wall biosynthesis
VRTKRNKTITFVIPCFNSAAYMDACIESILGGGRDVEIIIVNDGSTKDDTAEKADEWVEAHPDIIKVIHQENAGHGGAVMAGLRAATGVYFKVVDSDDWLDRTARDLLMAKLRGFIAGDNLVDLVVCNYVYEHIQTGSQKIIRYRGALPTNKIIGWDEVGVFGPGQNILMHAAVFRTQVLRDSGLELPKHTFYVDNIFVYVPLPYVKTLHYLPVNLYRYFIGRDDQSVNEPVQLGRLDQQMRVTNALIDAYLLPDEIPSKRLAGYMEGFLAVIIAASSMFSVLRGDAEALHMRKQMWADFYAKDEKMAKRLGHHPLVLGSNLSSTSGRRLSVALYRLAQRLYRFS